MNLMPSESEFKIGNNIRKIRTTKNMAPVIVADYLGIGLSGYGRIERDEVEITISKTFKICKLFEISFNDLFSYNDSEKIEEEGGG